MAAKKLWVFWKYDHYPFLLGAPVEKMLPMNQVVPKGYNGGGVTPVCILNEKTGMELRRELGRLQQQHAQFQTEIANTTKEALKEVLRKFNVPTF